MNAEATAIAEVAASMFAARREARSLKGGPKGLAVARANRLNAKLMKLMIAGVRAHAVANYDRAGWDIVVEAMDDAELAKEIGTAESLSGAIRRVGELVGLLHGRRREIEATEF